MNKNFLILFLILSAIKLPVCAKLSGGVAKGHFFDEKSTLMNEVVVDTNIKTQKYWEKNLFYSNKYRPLFLLSNRELYDLMPRENIGIVNRISTPSVYNISLKSATIQKISFANPSFKEAKQANSIKFNDNKLKLLYEDAKGPLVDPEKKIDAAVMLKSSSNPTEADLALNLLSEVIVKEPYNAYAYYLKGEIYSQKRDFNNAMKNYVEALKINPTSKQCCLGIAKILEPTNKSLAQKYYDKAK